MKPVGLTLPGAARRGATLLVTLGILTVLGVLAMTFLLTSRLQRQATVNQQHRLAARNHIDEGLHLAMKFVEDAFTYPNYTGEEIPAGAYLSQQRLAPVGHWFDDEYRTKNGMSEDISFQSGDVLVSPALSNAAPSELVNLITPSVLSLIPCALTNGLQLSSNKKPYLRSGWQELDLMMGNEVDVQLRTHQARVAFAVFNCSSFLDANHFISGPTTQKLPRVCFSQADVSNWVAAARSEFPDRFEALDEVLDLDNADESPFFHLSYDPAPDTYPLHYDCFETCTTVGTYAFGSGLTIDLNTPLVGQVLAGLSQLTQDNAVNKINFHRFNLNSVTNHFGLGTHSTDTAAPWFNDASFRQRWLDPVVYLLNMMKAEEPVNTSFRWDNSAELAWTAANFMDEDRIPQISDFVDSELPTRANYAVEDVPLINKISIFNLYDEDGSGANDEAPKEPGYYDLPSSGLSNHYAVAVELWYPFAPNQPPDDTACYVGIYTNPLDVVTTTNRPWTRNEMRDWFDWNSADNSNSVMQTLFNIWGRSYTNAVGAALAGHPLWQTVTNQSSLWFTPDMTNHPSWPVAGTNGSVTLADTPIWQAFYPDTFGVVNTNADGTATTNLYTYLTTTNNHVAWINNDDGSTNRLLGPVGTFSPDPYPVLLWTNLTAGTLTTNVLGALLDPDSNLFTFYVPLNPLQTNHLHDIAANPDAGQIDVTVSNGLTGAVFVTNAVSFVLSPWSNDGSVTFALQTNLLIQTEILPVEPLPMPQNLGLALAALFALMPTNSTTALYDFLMLRPDQYDEDDWDDLFDYFSENPAVIEQLLPSNQEPTLGNMTAEDRHAVWPDPESETVEINTEKVTPASKFEGYFWTVYPKQTVSFKEVLEEKDPDTKVVISSVTNYYALGKKMPKSSKDNTIWVRPVVTVREADSETPAEDATLSDVIVDEALLTYQDDDAVPVRGWTSVTNLFIPDPRRNAYARDWEGFEEPWESVINTTNLNTGVSEMPFMHFNKPLASIGELGHLYAAYERRTEGEHASSSAQRRDYDTLTFSTRSGAALLDLFTVSPANAPRRGLVQANTQQRGVLRALLADVEVGWTNSLSDESGQVSLRTLDSGLEKWPEVYVDALTNAPFSMGWRSFADMMPTLSTNKLIREENVWGGGKELHSLHDYTEDALRGLIDKVSFRQNVFVIVVAAQALSPASTPNRPVVLSDQRAAVTVLRDAYTGRWTIHSWHWLTE